MVTSWWWLSWWVALFTKRTRHKAVFPVKQPLFYGLMTDRQQWMLILYVAEGFLAADCGTDVAGHICMEQELSTHM